MSICTQAAQCIGNYWILEVRVKILRSDKLLFNQGCVYRFSKWYPYSQVLAQRK